MEKQIKKIKSFHASRFTLHVCGFTLIEVLMVVGIIALLASVVLVGLGPFRTRGRDTRRIADLRSTQNGLELYYTKFAQYPDDGGAGPDAWTALERTLQESKIGVSKLSHDPLVGKSGQDDYGYDVSRDRQSYVLRAQLEDASNPVLNDDFDGFVGAGAIDGITMSCADVPRAYYCVQF